VTARGDETPRAATAEAAHIAAAIENSAQRSKPDVVSEASAALRRAKLR